MTERAARILLVLSVSGWGAVFIANHELLKVLAPIDIVVLRFGVAAPAFVLMLLLWPARRPRLSRPDWMMVVLGGLVVIPGSQMFAVAGQQYLSPSMSGLLVTTTPAFAAVLAYRFLGERLDGQQVLGVILALLGASTIVVFATGVGTEFIVRSPFGASLFLVSQLLWASYTVLTRRNAQRHDPIGLVAITFLTGTFWLLPWAPRAVASAAAMTPTLWGWMGLLVVVGTLIPHIMWYVALSHLPANSTAVAMYLVPFYAALLSVTILGERITLAGALGGLLVLTGVALSQSSSQRRRKERRPEQGRTG